MGLLLDGLMYVFKEIADRADQELNNDEAVKAELMALHASLEAGSITEEAFEAKELELVERLQEIEERRAPRRPPPRKLSVTRRTRRAKKPSVVAFVDAATAPTDAATAPTDAATAPMDAASPPAPPAEPPRDTVKSPASDIPPSTQKGRDRVHA